MKKSLRMAYPALAVANLLAFLPACSSPYRVEYLEDSLRQTTQAELVRKFGYPQRLKRIKQGDTVWEYDFQGKGSECASYVITFSQTEEVTRWDRRDCGATASDAKSLK